MLLVQQRELIIRLGLGQTLLLGLSVFNHTCELVKGVWVIIKSGAFIVWDEESFYVILDSSVICFLSAGFEAVMDGDGEGAARAQLCVLQLRSFHLHLYYDQTDGLVAMLYRRTQRLAVVFFRRVLTAVIQNGDRKHSSV